MKGNDFIAQLASEEEEAEETSDTNVRSQERKLKGMHLRRTRRRPEQVKDAAHHHHSESCDLLGLEEIEDVQLEGSMRLRSTRGSTTDQRKLHKEVTTKEKLSAIVD